MRALRALREGVELPGGVATWVLVAHAYATFVPLALVGVAARHRDWLDAVADFPALLFAAAAALLCAGSAFEVAQNAADRWYITDGTGSAGEPAFCDFLFSWCITAGQALVAVALAGRSPWITGVAVAAVLAQPACYLARRAVFAPLAVTGLLAAVAAWRVAGDPLVFLQVPMAGVTLYFFSALLRTGAQALHGFTTVAAASGTWFLVAGLGNGAAGTPVPWTAVIAVVVAGALAGGLAWRPLGALRPTPRGAGV